MLMLHRKKHGSTSIGIAVAVIAAAHIAAGVLLCKGSCHHSVTLPKIAKRAKRTVVGLVREFL